MKLHDYSLGVYLLLDCYILLYIMQAKIKLPHIYRQK